MTDMRRVLFVDDELLVLEGLKDLLSLIYRDWEMDFVQSAREALELLEQKTYDVIVSDIRMPGMDGADLLNEVKDLYPQMVRIALSGYKDDVTIFRSVGPSHQFLAKPVTADTLRTSLQRACALRDLLRSERLQGLISQIESLPSLPSLYLELVEELQNPEASIRKIESIISRDIAMSAKILQMVNSAFFGFRQHIGSPGQAVVLLGLDTVKSLVLSVGVFSQFSEEESSSFSMEALWSHSLAVGTFAKRIAKLENCDSKSVDHAFIGGMLHDVGRLILASKMPQEYDTSVELIKSEGGRTTDIENMVFGTTHGMVGGYLLGLWGFPEPVIDAVAYHHLPGNSFGDRFMPLTAVHAANVMAHQLDNGIEPFGLPAMHDDYIDRIGMGQRVAVWKELCEKSLERVGAF